MTELAIPAPSLVVLVGVSGSGKSTFARKHFGPYEVVSSDFCRGLVADDENDQDATKDAFDVLGYIVGKRLERGRLTVVDATNVQPNARRHLLAIAKQHDLLPVAIVLDVPDSVAIERNRDRADRDFGVGVVKRQSSQLHKSLNRLAKEGFRRVHVLTGEAEIDAATLVREPLLNDRRDEHGPFDAIGDVHGCRSELETLLTRLGYRLVRDDQGRPVDAVPPDGRRAIFLGDLVDRGPDSPGVLRLVMGMVAAGHALCLPGNHENKLVRALSGRQVQISHGLETTLEQLEAEDPAFTEQVKEFCDGLVAHLVLDDGRLVVSHAGLKEAYHGRASARVRSFALYGDTTGETDEFGLPVRYPWAEDYRGRAMVLYGHTPVPETTWVNNTLCLDTGCVFGGRLTALRYPEKEIVSVPAERVWYEPVKPLAAATPERVPGQLDITDVLGKRVIETALQGRVTIKEEDAAGALEVMSRFALHPRLLPYLPPTMAPVATSRRDDLLEHPDEAFAAYDDLGVTSLVCEEKHMGSRAVVLVRREDDADSAIYTRTGRSFFDTGTTSRLLAAVRDAIGGAGLWAELATDWLLLDAELLPWSAKAEGLLKDQYAATGAAARSSLPPAVGSLSQALARGVDVRALAERTTARVAGAHAFTEAYRRYCWPTDGTNGVQLAPFQVLASAGRTWADRDHGWHLEVADRLVAQDPVVFRTTRRLAVDTTDAASTRAGVTWWEELTAAGGEGMVVKPMANLTRTAKGLAQPGLKVRGREYLRLVYGPDYTRPEHLARLRDRNLQRKRSLALREYALGLESLERFVNGEPLWRVHEAVFAVLALESEPVDPRL
ncbi:MAG: polynucleotide kinase-phosphatase [Nocardioides sp.]